MRLKKLLVLVVVIIISIAITPTTALNAQETIELPELTLPEPPEWQEGDGEEAITTVWAMRNALYYYGLVPLLIEYSNGVSSIAVETAKKADTFRIELAQETAEKEQWKKWTIIAVVGDAVLLGILTYVAMN